VIRIAFAHYASRWLRELPSLNREGIEPFRGRAWNASTIHGSAKRASAVICNEADQGTSSAHRAGGALAGDDRTPRQGENVNRRGVPAPIGTLSY
jgi:hypothetical protein